MAIKDRFKGAWNAFLGRDPTEERRYTHNVYYGGWRPDRFQMTGAGRDSTVSTIINQIAVDCSAIDIRHVKLNEDKNFKEVVYDSLNEVLSSSANLDQTGRSFIREAILKLLDKGAVALVPVETDINPGSTESFKILTARTGEITAWQPYSISVSIYNDITGEKVEITVPKSTTAIIENPFYNIMNEPNSLIKQLLRVESQIASLNNEISANKLDLIIQLPYPAKSPARKAMAEERQKEIVAQLTNSQYGIAYIDGTEKVIQLNRSLENNLWIQKMDLTKQVYNQFGFSEAIFNGTADEQTMLNYYNRTIEPILSAFTEEMERKWLSKTARTQGHAIRYFRDPFKLVPVAQFAEIADKLTRNEIMSSNELRSKIGLKPSNDPKADQLINSNLNQPDNGNQSITPSGKDISLDKTLSKIQNEKV